MGCGASKPDVNEQHGQQDGKARSTASKAPGPDDAFNYSSAAQSPKHTVWQQQPGLPWPRNPSDSCSRRPHELELKCCDGPAQVKMSIACKNLAVSQTVGCQPPDPYAALYVADSRGHWEQVSRTETVQNARGATTPSGPFPPSVLILCRWGCDPK